MEKIIDPQSYNQTLNYAKRLAKDHARIAEAMKLIVREIGYCQVSERDYPQYKKWEDILQSIQTINESYAADLDYIREAVWEEFTSRIELQFGAEIANEIRSAFITNKR